MFAAVVCVRAVVVVVGVGAVVVCGDGRGWVRDCGCVAMWGRFCLNLLESGCNGR